MAKRKLILKCGLSPGDIVMLTAAVRDLHHWYPGQFLTDVRTVCPDLWENNPHITPLSDDDPEATQIDCLYPLIDRCDRAPYHCLHGFIEFLNEQLELSIKPTMFKGDIHLSQPEKDWASQVYELTNRDIPFWIVAAGGKYDVTIKWWESKRYQAVVDHFRDRIQFVQVGDFGHHHPRLSGAIDLRGQTNLRQLIRLVYHSAGVLCSVTALMHLAAAVEKKNRHAGRRPCVVVAGGREPAHWEAYPGHQFIHTNGALPCCAENGCWKDRTSRLRDGDKRDGRNHLCVDVLNGIPHCMDLISSVEVIRRIELYYKGGALKYLSAREQTAAASGIAASRKNPYDQQPLTLSSAGRACDQFIRTIPEYPGAYEGRGIVICGGGVGYFTNAWVCINMLRRFNCQLPVELWYLDDKELDDEMKALVAPLGVTCVNARRVRRKHPIRRLHGWELKPYAILHSKFREVLFLDADNVPVTNPEYLFQTKQFGKTGAIFWPDFGSGIAPKALPIWRSSGLRPPREREFETGQIVLDKKRCWRALQLCVWFNANSDFYYRYIYGDKETFHLAFRKSRKSYSLIPTPIHALEKTMCQHDFDRKRIFQHRNCDKWDLFLRNRKVPDFWFEKECREYLAQLQTRWSGRFRDAVKTRLPKKRPAKFPRIEAVLFSHPAESKLQTAKNLAATDWDRQPLQIEIGDGAGSDAGEQQIQHAYLALKEGLKSASEYLLLLEGVVNFNRHIRHNLQNWAPLRSGRVTLAGLYNAKTRDLACDTGSNVRVVDPNSIFASQALLISRATAEYVVRNWQKVNGTPALRISRLAARKKQPIFYHAPSLVQPIATTEPPEFFALPAKDFDPDWLAQTSA